jgi:hypothetical protein
MVRQAVADFTASRKYACGHITGRSAKCLFLCAQHPRFGLFCEHCGRDHLARHDRAIEQTCDECGTEVELIHGGSILYQAVGLPVRTPRGSRVRVVGPIHVIGTGLCPSCCSAIPASAMRESA